MSGKISPYAYCATAGCLQKSGHAGLCTEERERREKEREQYEKAELTAARAVVEAARDMADSYDEMCGPLSTIDDCRTALAVYDALVSGEGKGGE